MNLLRRLTDLQLARMVPVCLRAGAGEVKEPPTEFRIFSMGTVESEKGDFVFDQAAAEMVMAAYKDAATELSFDYEHQAFADPPVEAPAAGWAELELRADGLYAVKCRWTDKAAAYLSAGEYRYFSPAFTHDKQGRVDKLYNVALTNTPAIHGLTPLVQASAAPVRDCRVVKASADLSFDQVREALCRAVQSAYPDAYAYVCDVYDATVVVCVRDRLYQLPYRLEGARAVLEEGAVEVQRTYTPIAQSGEGENMKTVLATLNLKPDATEAEALAELNKLNAERLNLQTGRVDLEREFITLAGAKTLGEAKGTFAAWKEAAGQVTTLSARLGELEQAGKLKEVEQLVAEGMRAGKIPPAQKDFWTEHGKKDVTMLRTFLEKAPKLVATQDEPAGKPAGEGDVVTLTVAEKHAAKRLGISEAEYLANKQRLEAKDRAAREAQK